MEALGRRQVDGHDQHPGCIGAAREELRERRTVDLLRVHAVRAGDRDDVGGLGGGEQRLELRKIVLR
jgi:hypothetical protein